MTSFDQDNKLFYLINFTEAHNSEPSHVLKVIRPFFCVGN